MAQTRTGSRRSMSLGAAGIALAFVAAACGGSASPSAAASASSAPSVAAPSPSASPSPSPSQAPSVVPSAAASLSAEDPAKGLTIAAPYTLVELDPALNQYFRNQMTASMGAFGGLFSIGLRQVDGGKATANVLIVMGFPNGTLDETSYAAVLTGMTQSMAGGTLTKSTESGVEISSGTIPSGTIAAFHIADHLILVVSSGAPEALPVAKAVVQANQ